MSTTAQIKRVREGADSLRADIAFAMEVIGDNEKMREKLANALQPLGHDIGAVIAPLVRERDLLKAAAGFCEKHQPTGGYRNCVICAFERQFHALSEIASICEGNPEATAYDVYCNETEVVKQVATLVRERDRIKDELGLQTRAAKTWSESAQASYDREAALREEVRDLREELEKAVQAHHCGTGVKGDESLVCMDGSWLDTAEAALAKHPSL